jgi:hypothetical protein
MTVAPLRAKRKHYYGRDHAKQQRVVEQNRNIDRIERHANQLLADCPQEYEWLQLLFGEIANNLSVDVRLVREALSDGGYNGITVGLPPASRELLELFKTSASHRIAEAWPRLSDGRDAAEVATERCGRATAAFP